jgi:hypothetical protein
VGVPIAPPAQSWEVEMGEIREFIENAACFLAGMTVAFLLVAVWSDPPVNPPDLEDQLNEPIDFPLDELPESKARST